ncbi:MAG: hypothetical protein ACXVMS_02665 [Flavisolibacter sp.]
MPLFFIGLFLVGATILTHLITVYSPFKKYEKLEKNKWVLVDNITSKFLGQQLFSDYNIAGNIMIPKKVFYTNIEPCACTTRWEKIKCFRNRFKKKILNPIWLSGNHTLNKKFKITTNHGVSGKAFIDGVVAMVDITKSINELNLNDKQKAVISGNGFVISYPIFEFDEKYSRLGTKIIGVVTLSCNKVGAEELLKDAGNREILTEKIVEFSRICSLIL